MYPKSSTRKKTKFGARLAGSAAVAATLKGQTDASANASEAVQTARRALPGYGSMTVSLDDDPLAKNGPQASMTAR
jgi:hypothetical protein